MAVGKVAFRTEEEVRRDFGVEERDCGVEVDDSGVA
jgi:hypothetical protein